MLKSATGCSLAALLTPFECRVAAVPGVLDPPPDSRGEVTLFSFDNVSISSYESFRLAHFAIWSGGPSELLPLDNATRMDQSKTE